MSAHARSEAGDTVIIDRCDHDDGNVLLISPDNSGRKKSLTHHKHQALLLNQAAGEQQSQARPRSASGPHLRRLLKASLCNIDHKAFVAVGFAVHFENGTDCRAPAILRRPPQACKCWRSVGAVVISEIPKSQIRRACGERDARGTKGHLGDCGD
jgi:hypothetical protein